MTVMATTSRESIVCAGSSATPALQPSKVATNQGSVAGRAVPLFIPADQAYFWSAQWQRDEAESLANLKAGNARTFHDPMDAIRHLLSDD
jgi:hypothetical protein